LKVRKLIKMRNFPCQDLAHTTIEVVITHPKISLYCYNLKLTFKANIGRNPCMSFWFVNVRCQFLSRHYRRRLCLSSTNQYRLYFEVLIKKYKLENMCRNYGSKCYSVQEEKKKLWCFCTNMIVSLLALCWSQPSEIQIRGKLPSFWEVGPIYLLHRIVHCIIILLYLHPTFDVFLYLARAHYRLIF
jgi:hypothetical protein